MDMFVFFMDETLVKIFDLFIDFVNNFKTYNLFTFGQKLTIWLKGVA